jgi:membrane protease YdiL (CAAX protease family)
VNWRGIFFGEGRFRPVWRFFVSAGAIFVAIIAVNLAVQFAFGAAGKPTGVIPLMASFTVLLLPVLLGIFKILSVVFEQRPLGAVGLAFCGRWRSELGLGLAVGTLMVLAVAAIEWVSGAASFSWSGETLVPALGWGLFLFLVLAVAAANEELVFRGYPFQRLVESVGPVLAIALLSALFGLMHYRNPHRTWVSTANTVLVGIPFSIAYLRTRMLWLPVGMHFAWNFVQGFILGLPVSGIQVPVSLLRAEVSGRELLTGGAYGPEGGVLALIIIVLATGYLAFSKRIYIGEETKALVFGRRGVPAMGSTGLELSDSPVCVRSNPPEGQS